MKIKIRTVKSIGYSLLFLVIVFLAGYFYYNNYYVDKFYLSENGYLTHIGKVPVSFSSMVVEKTSDYTKKKIIFQSKDAEIYADLYLPTISSKENKVNNNVVDTTKFDAILFLPAAQKTKEDTTERGKALAKLGYAALILDVRGVGETKGQLNSIEQDYQLFLAGKEPVYHLTIYDALVAAKVLEQIPEVKNVVYAGESLGGRTAIIAGAIEDKNGVNNYLSNAENHGRIKGVLAISTAGYGDIKNPDKNVQRYLNSINPDFYAANIAPRKIVFMHADNETVIPIDLARKTFNKAAEPKKFVVISNSSCHGYCKGMDEELKKALRELFEDV